MWTSVTVAIEHTYIGDLIVQLVPPTGSGVGAVVLHNRSGGSAENLKRTFDTNSTPELAQLIGTSPEGVWALQVEDKAKQDTGRILSFTVELDL